jgi:AraC-like DNA-binding protein
MSDFASSAMLRVLHAGMRRLGLESPAQAWFKSAKVPLDAKRQLVGQVLAQRGWVGLLQLGEGVQDIEGEVLFDYLSASAEPRQILHSWLRLERYVHSRHRLRLAYPSPQHVQMHHYSVVEGQAPTPAEDVVVLGVLLGTLDRCGLKDLQFCWDAAPSWWDWSAAAKSEATLRQVFELEASAHWQIQWHGANKPASPPASSHLAPVRGRDAWNGWGDWGGQHSWSRKVADWVGQQLLQSRVESLSLAQAADVLGVGERSLQRHLQAEGLRFVDVLGQVRVNLAASQLRLARCSLAEVGFSSGFADQAHFCREFKRRIGMSPLQWREQLLGTQR